MKLLFCKAMFLLVIVAILGIPQASRGQVDSAIEQLTGDNTKGYLQPFITAFGNNLNAGWYRSAAISKVGLHIYVGLSSMFSFIPDEDQVFSGIPPSPFPQTQVETATVFGDKGARIQGPGGLNYFFQDGQIQGDVVPMAVPQVEIGAILGTAVSMRYFAIDPGDVPSISLWGFGVRHSLSQYVPLFPIHLAGGFFYQKFEVGDIISARAVAYGIQASKSFALLDVYGGVSLENSQMDVDYTYEYGNESESVSLDLKGEDKYKITAGVALKLAGLILNGDYSLGSRNVATVGIGFGL